MGVASLVLGIIAIILGIFGSTGLFGLIIGIIGIILGAMARKKAMEAPEGSVERDKKGMATAGLVCSIVGTIISGLFFFACAALLGSAGVLSAFS